MPSTNAWTRGHNTYGFPLQKAAFLSQVRYIVTVYGAVPDPPESGYPPSTPSAIQRGQERMNESREGPWSCPTSPARQQPPELPHSSARAPPAHPVAPTEQRRSGRRAPCRHARRRSPQPEVTVQAERLRHPVWSRNPGRARPLPPGGRAYPVVGTLNCRTCRPGRTLHPRTASTAGPPALLQSPTLAQNKKTSE